jgi:ABC-type transport system involved in cytochrome bd biosynthesis fused ATPase/permease subunit
MLVFSKDFPRILQLVRLSATVLSQRAKVGASGSGKSTMLGELMKAAKNPAIS